MTGVQTCALPILAATPDERWLFVANFFDDTLAIFDADGLKRVALLETEAYPHGLGLSPDGRYAVATGFSSDSLRIYDARARTELARVEVGRGSSHIAFLGNFAFVCCSVADHVACVDLEARSEVARITLNA